MGWFVALQSNYNSNIEDHHNKYNEKAWNISRLTKTWHRDKWENSLGKIGANRLQHKAARKLQFVKKKKKNTKTHICEAQKVKCNKIRYACIDV